MKRLLFLLVMVSLFINVTGQQRDERRLRFGADQIPLINPGKQPSVALPPVQGRVANTTNTLLSSNIKINNNNGATATSHYTQAGASTLAYGDRVLVVFNDAGSANGGSHFTGYAYSSDQGATFTDGGVLPLGTGGDAGYPVLARNNITGRIYLTTQGFNNSLIQVFRSDNHGVTWMPPVVGTPGGNLEDKEWITVDTFPGTGNGNVYLVSRTFRTGGEGIRFYKSVDHGNTYGPTGGLLITPAPTCHGPVVVVGRDHAVYVFWYENTFIKMKKSNDQGATFGSEVVVASGIVSLSVNGDMGLVGIRNGLATTAPFRTNKFPQAVVNPVTGDIYVTYANDGAGVDKADIFFVSSANGGATWSAPIRVNDDLTTTDQWSPTIAVMPNGQNFGVFYYSRQEDPVGNNLYKYYGRVGTSVGGVTVFSAAGPVSDIQSFPEFGRDNIVNTVFFNDYDQVSASEHGFAVSWVDSREDLTTGPPRKDPNIYFSMVGPEGPTPIPALFYTSSVIEGGDGDGKVDINECNQLKITLQNIGFATATEINASLTTSTPGVTITQASSAYPDLNASASAYNLTDFSFCTGAGFVCGANIEFTLSVTYAEGTKTFLIIIPSDAVVGSPVSFHNNTPTAIPDNSLINLPIVVSGISGSINKVTVSLHLTHTFVSDLEISLISPDGTVVPLALRNGGSGDNFGTSCTGRTVFDDDAAVSITSGVAPFVGTFIPRSPLSAFKAFAGSDVNGNWTLRIADMVNIDVGTFQCATLTITPQTCATTTSGPTVTINQGTTQTDPTSTSPIIFDVVFSESVTGFDGTDISLTSSTAGGTLSALVTGTGANYTVSVSGMTSSGSVIATIPAGAAINTGAQGSQASTSIDNTVSYISASPTVTINQSAGQIDPTSIAPVNFTVVFSQSVTGFTGSDVSFAGSTAGGTLLANVTGSGTTYTVAVTGMTSSGTIVATIPAGVAVNGTGQTNLASTSTDNVVTFNVIPYDLVITKSGPPVAAIGIPIVYTITVFNLTGTPVQNFAITDVLPAGTEFLGIVNPHPFLILSTPPIGQNGPVLAFYPLVYTGSNGPIQLGIVLRVPPGSTLGSISNTATVTAGGFDINLLNNTSTATTQILFPPTITCPSNITVNATVTGCQGMVDLGALPFVITGTPTPTLTLAWTQAGLPVNVEVKPGIPQPTAFGLGTTTITATAANGVSPNATCTFSITVLDVGNPVITCPPNITVLADAGVCYATLTNAAIGIPVATDECDASLLVTHSTFPALNRFPVGSTQITWTATDDAGNAANCVQTIVVGDNEPPVITGVSATPAVLFPPNHKMKDVTINYTSSDNCGVVNCVLTVTSNEPVNGTGDGDTSPDWEVIDNHHVRLRAERAAHGNGRIYTITITCTDGQGNTSTATTEVHVAHNITAPHTGNSFRIGSTVSFAGEFWDKPGNSHTSKWMLDNSTSVNGVVTEPSGNQNGKVTGSYKFNSPGVYKLQMNVIDQAGNISYANTNGDLDAIVVVYDPNGGYAYGGGWFDSPAGALGNNPSTQGKASYGFAVNYKNIVKPKGETQFEFKVGDFEFNALNFDYLMVSGYKAQFRGTGKIVGVQSGLGFTMTVIDGELDGSGIDKIRMKIYNRNTGAVIYDNQPGAGDADDPLMAVGDNSTIFIKGNPVTPPVTTISRDENNGEDKLALHAWPNPSPGQFNISINGQESKDAILLQVIDQYGRVIETRNNITPGSTLLIGSKYRAGVYYVRIMQGMLRKETKLIKLDK